MRRSNETKLHRWRICCFEFCVKSFFCHSHIAARERIVKKENDLYTRDKDYDVEIVDLFHQPANGNKRVPLDMKPRLCVLSPVVVITTSISGINWIAELDVFDSLLRWSAYLRKSFALELLHKPNPVTKLLHDVTIMLNSLDANQTTSCTFSAREILLSMVSSKPVTSSRHSFLPMSPFAEIKIENVNKAAAHRDVATSDSSATRIFHHWNW